MTDHPITPPPELAKRLWDVLRDQTPILGSEKAWDSAIALAYAAGADQELEACCTLMDEWGLDADDLRAARRPQPEPTLKERALEAHSRFLNNAHTHANEMMRDFDTIRRALALVPEGPAVTPAAAAPDRPLWEAMNSAYLAVVENSMTPANSAGLAAELRTVAGEIARQFQDRHGVLEIGVRGVVAWLRAEAERAEAGEP